LLIKEEEMKFNELPEHIQARAIEKYREINITDDWYDHLYEYFQEDLREAGFFTVCFNPLMTQQIAEKFYRRLIEEYEHRTSDEAVIETLEYYEFTKEGVKL
jgi:hypothetical protein